MDKVSVIMPVYNRERFIATAIESVLSQTYDNFELIIVDDGSSDNSVSIAQRYRTLYPKKIQIIEQINQGPSIARNNAVKIATGSLLAFIDSDDFWARDKLELQTHIFKSHCNSIFTYTGYYIVNEDGDIIKEILPNIRLQGFIYDQLWKVENQISGGTILVHKNIFQSIGGFDENLRGAENLDLRIRLSRLGKVYFVNKCLYYYRRHNFNLTTETTAMNDAWLMLINKHFNRDSEYDKHLYRHVISKYYHDIGVNNFSKMRLYDAIPYFFRAIIKNPIMVESYVRLLRCCLGVRINSLLSSLKK